jgi:hypothetical protein
VLLKYHEVIAAQNLGEPKRARYTLLADVEFWLELYDLVLEIFCQCKPSVITVAGTSEYTRDIKANPMAHLQSVRIIYTVDSATNIQTFITVSFTWVFLATISLRMIPTTVPPIIKARLYGGGPEPNLLSNKKNAINVEIAPPNILLVNLAKNCLLLFFII